MYHYTLSDIQGLAKKRTVQHLRTFVCPRLHNAESGNSLTSAYLETTTNLKERRQTMKVENINSLIKRRRPFSWPKTCSGKEKLNKCPF